MSHIRLGIDHPGASSWPPFVELMLSRGNWTYALPLIVLIVGLACLRVRSSSLALFEVVIQLAWMTAIALPLFCILFWQIANIPTYSGGRAHY